VPPRRTRTEAIVAAAARLDDLDEWREAVERWLAGLDRQGTVLHEAADGILARLGRLERHDTLRTFSAWIDETAVATDRLVSVVLPTRNRSRYLARSVASVLAQAYENWELLIVDDGSTDDTASVLRSFSDPRIRPVVGVGRGACAARNIGVDAASGEIVAYLDDDNVMAPLWLKAVVWAFGQRPDATVAYGAIVIDDTARQLGVSGWEPPSLWLHSYDREILLERNLADTNSIAHRAGIAARWDEDLDDLGDWDFLLSATAPAPPVVIPVVAARYLSDAPNRLSSRVEPAKLSRLREKHGSRS